jgi:V8-like Glu-specific endopeptidase
MLQALIAGWLCLLTLSAFSSGPQVADTRRPVTGDFNAYNRTVGYLQGEVDSPSSVQRLSSCTAVSIGAHWILTAAHCLYDQNGRPLKNVYFYPGTRGEGHMPFDRFPVAHFYHPRQYRPTQIQNATLASTRYDIAFAYVRADSTGRSLSRRVGTLGLWGRTSIHPGPMTTLGYPSDRERRSLHMAENCRVEEVDPLLYRSNCYTESGQSGSPALFQSPSDPNSLHPGGVFSSTDLVSSYIVRVTAERNRIFNALSEGSFNQQQNSFTETWDHHLAPYDDRVNFFVKNNCSTDILIGWSTYDDGDVRRRMGQGFVRIAQGEIHLIDWTTYSTHFLHAHNSQGSIRLGSSSGEINMDVNGSRVPLYEMEVNRWGDHHHNINCNGLQ